MKELLCKYAAYNVWANHRLLYQLQQLEESDWYRQTPSSFDSLYKTVLHMWDAESLWWQRMRLHEHIVVPSASFDPSFKDACNGLLHQGMEWESYIRDILDEEALQSQVAYKNLKEETYQQKVSEILLHLFNHATYHRGQLITMMHGLGKKAALPATDFIAYCRNTVKD